MSNTQRTDKTNVLTLQWVHQAGMIRTYITLPDANWGNINVVGKRFSYEMITRHLYYE